jgi:hypothetical protein
VRREKRRGCDVRSPSTFSIHLFLFYFLFCLRVLDGRRPSFRASEIRGPSGTGGYARSSRAMACAQGAGLVLRM